VRVLITRPRADAETLAQALEARGHDVLVEPLLTILPIAGAVPDLAGVQAILLTSAHALPALAGADPGRSVFAVGDASARAARTAGCGDVRAAGGDAASLGRLVIAQCRPAAGALLHLAGTDVRPGLAEALLAAGFDFRRQAVYRAVAAVALSQPTIAALRARTIDAVLLFSPRSAAIFADLIAGHGLSDCLGQSEAICLSDAVAAACHRLRWAAVRTAAQPEVEALLQQLEGQGRRC
jgi:uroporphyrinogen-III synthase